MKISKENNWNKSIEELNEDFKEDLVSSLKKFEYLWPKKRKSRLIKYSDLIGEYDRPKLWWNDPSYILANVKTERQLEFVFKLGKYWDNVDTLEALAYESADCERLLPATDSLQFSKLKARKS